MMFRYPKLIMNQKQMRKKYKLSLVVKITNKELKI